MRRKTRKIRVGNIYIGGDAPVSVQGMTKCSTADIKSLIPEAKRMVRAGAEIIRVSILDEEDISGLKAIKENISIPMVADIHYHKKLAILAMESGADKIRINPGNIKEKEIKEIVKVAKEKDIAIRIGVNSGSVKIKGALSDSMVDSALNTIKLFEDMDFYNIVISLKTPSVEETTTCYRKISQLVDYPLHLGVTEAGRGYLALSKSVLGIGVLLLEGIGDTIRVSLTEPSHKEIELGRSILQALGIRRFFPEIISCPTCGRVQVNLKGVLDRVEKGLKEMGRKYPGIKNLKIAVMGCSVNGPGEARQADIGIAGGKEKFVLFRKSIIIGSYPEKIIVEKLLTEVKKILTKGEKWKN
ncbi:MAG: flavodoxin-dependent (E)-4-hydroxy-3-methylbut-2-enyl-diphosphate synthase [Candidatus Omnitrophica bacterium]|nr:flavodoxin-dependent (E)-4-hydroxy-3-methylbut-2-enyl-diphosphate synthase [Candidatus Omnitrophota bacterium]MCM8777682.1 flavodoxin-dependent (E)-4-hydroxy-3-methylbut-2-enyl-diphosphate synthase [Candidatus Omnitrophota bacterium]